MTAVTAVIAAATAVVIAPTAATVVTVKSVLRSVVFNRSHSRYRGDNRSCCTNYNRRAGLKARSGKNCNYYTYVSHFLFRIVTRKGFPPCPILYDMKSQVQKVLVILVFI